MVTDELPAVASADIPSTTFHATVTPSTAPVTRIPCGSSPPGTNVVVGATSSRLTVASSADTVTLPSTTAADGPSGAFSPVSVTLVSTETDSGYVPPRTQIVSPDPAASTAAWIVV